MESWIQRTRRPLPPVVLVQQDVAAATKLLLQNVRGQQPVKRVKRSTVRLQRQLQTIRRDHHDGCKSVANTLCAVSLTVRFH